MENLKAWVEINLSNILHNFDEIQRFVGVKIMPIIKADAYGHGIVEIANILKDKASIFGVATLCEAMKLRNFNIKNDILILAPSMNYDLEEIIQNNIICTIATFEDAVTLNNVALKLDKKANIHIKLDTGMGRIGFNISEDTINQILLINKLANINIKGVFSHFAQGEDLDTSFTKLQYQKFEFITNEIQKHIEYFEKHICASGTIINCKDMHLDIVRPGALLYGIFPSFEIKNPLNIKPAMSVKARVVFINHIHVGESIGYNRTYFAKVPTTTAIIMYGYADGYLTNFSNKSYVSINKKKCNIIGRICMDQIIIDVTNVKDIKVGDIVHVIEDDGPSILELSKLGNINAREIQCLTTTGNRLQRIYKK
ncbi:MAG: alanine racemase [Defluviitaleaceae bacterium]|nr:alanine racemase [Defluviitaleaceae bacterium]